LTKIIGKRSRHSMLASTPASILNHKTSKNGIPADSTKSGYALVASSGENIVTYVPRSEIKQIDIGWKK
ncbi:hypothetical protein, partial [Rhizobium laguerreae]|uniref:hypothetical protein n=1 Tax=Rhizobium laguerreae TaxID=1076926 RepID=UPI001C92B577